MSDYLMHDVEGLRDTDAVAGTAAAVELVTAVTAIGNDSLFRFGGDRIDDPPLDGRDYSAMATVVEAALTEHYVNAGPAHRRGFALALADLLCIAGDGHGFGSIESWRPAETISEAHALALAHGV